MSLNTHTTATPSAQTYRHAMANLAAGVHVITTDGAVGRYGITMTAVTSVTDEPPTMLLCINRQAAIQPILRGNGTLCINILAAHQRDVAEHFAGLTQLTNEERFRRHVWAPGPFGQPQLTGALAHLHGHIHEYHDMGSHTVFYVRIDHIDVADDAQPAALLYFRRQFGHSAS